jgi:hypothetical protein
MILIISTSNLPVDVTVIIMLTNGIIPSPYESKLFRNCLDIAGHKTLVVNNNADI